VADVYDAMASDRAYRKRIADEIIIETIQNNAGTQFDHDVVDGFLVAYARGLFSGKENPDMVNSTPRRNKLELSVLSRLSVNTNGIS